MNISGDSSLISSQVTLLQNISAIPFNFGGFSSLDDILNQCGVKVIIEAGKPKRTLPEEFDEIEDFWQKKYDEHIKQQEDTDEFDYDELNEIESRLGLVRNEKYRLLEMSLLGLYDPNSYVIKLFPENMMDEYGGTKMDELLVSTLAHEAMHAYFDRPKERRSYPYNHFVEEPMAEFGMLYYLSQTKSQYYNWAFKDVSSKKTCYRFGADLMTQYLNEVKVGTSSKTLDFLVNYKIKISPYDVIIPDIHDHSVINLPASGSRSRLYAGGSKINWKRVFRINNCSPYYFYDEKKKILCLIGHWPKTKQTKKDISLMAGNIKFTGKTNYEIELKIKIPPRESGPIIYLWDNFNMDKDRFELQDLLFRASKVVVSRNNKDILPIKPGEPFFKVNSKLLMEIRPNRFVRWDSWWEKFGVIDENLNEVLKCEYDEIPVANDDGTYTVVKDGKTYKIKE